MNRYALWFVLASVLNLICHPLCPSDTVVVQVQQWGVVGTGQVVDQVILNGVVLTDTKEVDIIIRTISADAHLLALTGANQTIAPGKKKEREKKRRSKKEMFNVSEYIFELCTNLPLCRLTS